MSKILPFDRTGRAHLGAPATTTSSAFTRGDYEDAALAAGLTDYAWSDEHLCMVETAGYSADSPLAGAVYVWDPSEDDGDAQRLSVKLKFKTVHWPAAVEVHIPTSSRECFTERYDGDPDRATRHAIFRAAIALGRALRG